MRWPWAKKKHDSLRDDLAKWVRKNIGPEAVQEAVEKYDVLCNGGTIGGFAETVYFLDLIEHVKRGDDHD